MNVLLIQNCEIEPLRSFEEYLNERSIDHQTLQAYSNEEFPRIENFDAIIVGGTPLSVYNSAEHPFMIRECEFIRNVLRTTRPYLGICGGGQLLAKVLGAEVRRNRVQEIGVYQVQLTEEGKKDSIFAGFPHIFPVFQWHGDTFHIPQGAKLLAEGRDCKNQAFRYNNSVALQFHLEVSSDDASKWSDEYHADLSEMGKTKVEVVDEYTRNEDHLRRLAYGLLDNFFEQV